MEVLFCLLFFLTIFVSSTSCLPRTRTHLSSYLMIIFSEGLVLMSDSSPSDLEKWAFPELFSGTADGTLSSSSLGEL